MQIKRVLFLSDKLKSAPTPDDKQEVDMTALPVKYDR